MVFPWLSYVPPSGGVELGEAQFQLATLPPRAAASHILAVARMVRSLCKCFLVSNTQTQTRYGYDNHRIIDQQRFSSHCSSGTMSGWWLTYIPLKKVGKSIGMMKFPSEWKHKKMFQTTNQIYKDTTITEFKRIHLQFNVKQTINSVEDMYNRVKCNKSCRVIPYGNLTQLWKITMFNGKIHVFSGHCQQLCQALPDEGKPSKSKPTKHTFRY